MHDAGEVATCLAELLLGFTSEPRVCRGSVHDEDAPNRHASELLADLVSLVERLQRLRDGPEVERARLKREHGDVGRDGGALRDVAEPRWPVEENLVVAAHDLF